MKISKSLTHRENEVIDLLSQGMSNKQIAFGLGVSERTVEFHLNNIYGKLQVASRVELILKLGRGNPANPVESTVVFSDGIQDNDSQPARARWARFLKNTVSLIKKEVAMTVHISFEDLENYLKSHPLLLSLLVLLAASLTARYVIFDIGLYFWVSYLLLGLLLGIGSVRFSRALRGNVKLRPVLLILLAASLPLIAAGFDQLYLNTVLRFTDPVSISIADISATAQWLTSLEGGLYRSTRLSTASDLLWFIAIAYMILLFFISRIVGNRSDHLATA